MTPPSRRERLASALLDAVLIALLGVLAWIVFGEAMAHAAPVPFAAKAARAPAPIAPGRYVQRWGCSTYPTVLGADGAWTGGAHRGWWRAEGRTLAVIESLGRGEPIMWRAVLDDAGEGEAVCLRTGQPITRVRMERIP